MNGTTLRRVTRVAGATLLAAAVAPWMAVGTAHAASSTAPPSGDARAVAYSGNATTCEDVGFADSKQVGASESSGSTADGFTVTNDGTYIDYTAPDGVAIDVAVVKGSDAYNVYQPGATTKLHAPLTGNDKNIAGVSHWFICYHDATPPETTSPSVDFSDDCDSTTVTFTQGSEPATFTVVKPDGTITTTDGDEPLQLPADADHATTTVKVGQTELGSHDWTAPEEGCGGETEPPVVLAGPVADIASDCQDGFVVSLANDAEEGAASTVFTVTAPDGTVSQHTVVAGDDEVLTFPAKDGDTVSVDNSAFDGAQSASYAPEGCTDVEGEHTDKPTPGVTVLGERDVNKPQPLAGGLPFTGFNMTQGIALSAMLILLGSLLLAAPRRLPVAYQRRH